jgi:hypothetical protein
MGIYGLAFEWLTSLLCIQEVLEAGCPDFNFSWYSLLPPFKNLG